MSEAELALRRIEAILTDIEQTQRELGFPAGQASDREAFDIVSRIERRLQQRPDSLPQREAAHVEP